MAKNKSNRLVKALDELFESAPQYQDAGVDKAQVRKLLDVYFRHIALDDLEEREPQDLLGALIAHWRLMRQRDPDQALARVYNPDQEEDGWRSRDTIIEVVVDDMPFLVDSLSAEVNRRGLAVRFTAHPVIAVERDSDGTLTDLHALPGSPDRGAAEAVIQMHVDRQSPEGLGELQAAVLDVIGDVRRTTRDWAPMVRQAEEISADLARLPSPETAAETEEARQFLNWMIHDHFLFIGVGLYSWDGEGPRSALHFDEASGLGMLRGGAEAAARARDWISGLDAGVWDEAGDLLVTKANARSTVHRPSYMDCVTVRRRDEHGTITGLWCLVGLFSSSAYTTPPRQIPLLRTKVQQVFEGAQVITQSHSGRALANILDNLPRDTLFQMTADELTQTVLGVLGLQERQRIRLFVLEEPFRRFSNCLVYLPRERYSREVRLAIQALLVESFGGTDVVFETQFSESILARIHFVVWYPTGSRPDLDLEALEARVVDVATTWQDALRQALFSQADEVQAARYLRRYAAAFPGGYREDTHPRVAVADIQRMERAREQGRVIVHLYHPIAESNERVHVRLYAPDLPLSLSRVIPVLEHMGLEVSGERPYRIQLDDGDVWIHDFSTARPSATEPVESATRRRFTEAFLRAWYGQVDNDGFNGLVLRADLDWREAMLFRAYSRYLRQIKVAYTDSYMVAVLHRYPAIVRLLTNLFEARFDPGGTPDSRTQRAERTLAALEEAMEQVVRLDEDRILRGYANLIGSTLRTNFYQRRGDDTLPYLAFKFDTRRVEGMPAPRPMFEIFVCSAAMEGVHLRGGRVARGGLRWSDRMEDYRTEILGLMKAQMVKNTVIVPVGSKGGFVVRNLRADEPGEARADKVVAAYKTLLRGMLDLTDNRVGGDVVPPPLVIRHDDDDPYLVIAADKGTATFSDIANAVSAEYGFWLGDAFASGGSAGYDHKAMGITARGAWESVKRNFRELGHDTQQADFSVVGIGDMSGDVFGNGMLLSPHIRLRGAFNHRHIFLDPEPDPKASFAERRRLFELPRSGWSDYDRRLISAGGGVFSRDAKSIAVSPEVRQWLGIKTARVPPNELIRALLLAPVDLLWNGGIGTYVKASHETHEQASDKANDAVRVDASELRCRVIGEGGNLGLTQLARVEYALGGGQLYTDAIDNSAGVDCSDHEVNIKILLDRVVANGDMTLKQRNVLLAAMTDDVARLVLADNYAQTQAISVVASGGERRLYEQARFIELLEADADFDRRLEGLPERKQITERLAAAKGLTKPEIAVLLAYSKMNYYEAIVASDISDDPFVADFLSAYFPAQLRGRFSDEIAAHPLRREIIATAIAGTIADHVGPGIGFRVREEVGSDIAGVTRAYLTARAIFDTDRLWREVEALDNRVAAAVQTEILARIGGFLEQTLTHILRSYKGCLDMAELAGRFHDGVQALWDALPKALASGDRADFARLQRRLVQLGVPRELAQRIAGLTPMLAATDIVDVAAEAGVPIDQAAWIHSALNHTLDIEWIERRIGELPVQTHWHLFAKTKLSATLARYRRGLTAQIIGARRREKSARGILENWVRQHQAALHRYTANLAEFKAGTVFDFAVLSLVVARLGDLLPVGPERVAAD